MENQQFKFEALCPCCDRHYVASKTSLDKEDLEIYGQMGYTVKLCKKCRTVDFKKLMTQRWAW